MVFKSKVYSIKVILLLFVFSVKYGYCQTYGLYFSGPEVSKDQRTGLHLSEFKEFHFEDGFTLSFDLMLRPGIIKHHGFIYRIIANQSLNIDLIFEKQEDFDKMVFVVGDIMHELYTPCTNIYQEWTKFTISYYPDQNLNFTIGDSTYQQSLPENKLKNFDFYFGSVNSGLFETSAVPAMNIKNIKLSNLKNREYYWKLDEKEGSFANDNEHEIKAKVNNPVWLSKKHNNWEQLKLLTLNGDVCISYNPTSDRLYLVDNHSLTIINIDNYSTTKIQNLKNHPKQNNKTSCLYFNTSKNQLQLYSAASNLLYSLNDSNTSWNIDTIQSLNIPTISCSSYFYSNNKLYLIGGLTENNFSGNIYALNLNENKLQSIECNGDTLMPRYLCATNCFSNNSSYILGGFGSETGNPLINAHYDYNLYQFNTVTHQLVKETVSSNLHNFAFAKSLVVENKNQSIYALCFSAHHFEGNLQLIQWQKENNKWIESGDKIPFQYHKDNSNADLFYSQQAQKLIATTIYKNNQNQSVVSFYSLNSPPNKSNQLIEKETIKKKAWYWIILIFSVDFALFVGFYIKKKITDHRNKINNLKEEENRKAHDKLIRALAVGETPKSTIILFGGFQVFDQNGNDISKLFTPLIKELFLIILLYPFKNGKGITSKKLTEMLWFDKPADKAVNNRSVNMGKLKKIINLIGSCELSNANGYWTFIFNEDQPKMYIDIIDLKQIIKYETPTHEDVQRIIYIAEKGTLLSFLNYEWIEDIKERISSLLIDWLIEFLEQNNDIKDFDFVVKICDCILISDSLNEQAIAYKCKALIKMGKHGLAQKSFQKFQVEYKLLYVTKYEKQFRDIVK